MNGGKKKGCFTLLSFVDYYGMVGLGETNEKRERKDCLTELTVDLHGGDSSFN